VKNKRRLLYGLYPFDPVEAIDEAFVCKINSQMVFVLPASHRAVLMAARCMPSLDLTLSATGRKGAFYPGTIQIQTCGS